jgi:D-aminoacyl-tRNA deacylase
MTLVLVESLPDVASVGIATALRARPGWIQGRERFEDRPVWHFQHGPDVRLVTTAQHHIHAEGLDGQLSAAGIRPDRIVFLSKHKSESGRPTLTAHPLGNYRDAALGGRPRTLTPVHAPDFTHMLRCLDGARRRQGFPAEVSYEVTHHGPYLDVPAFFVELGSSEAQWADPVGQAVLADAVTEFLGSRPGPYPTVIGLGGGHYGPRFTEAALTKEVHFAHLLPTYHAEPMEDPLPIVRELKRACPGAVGVYYHDGTLKKEKRERWLAAFASEGLPQVESKMWPLRTAFDKSTNNALSDRPT